MAVTHAFAGMPRHREAGLSRCPAAQHGKRFRVVVADARPGGEGRATLRALLRAGIACTYVLLNAVPLVMQARPSALTPNMCTVMRLHEGSDAAV